jgi:hypothetical protein
MHLLNLQPWKQEELLFLDGSDAGRDGVMERVMRVWRPHSTKIP